jgi:starch phosphorylase
MAGAVVSGRLPRHLEIIYEINRHFLDDVRAGIPATRSASRVSRPHRRRREPTRAHGHLAIVGSHSTNGVAALHSELLKQRVVPDFAAMFSERFNNKTNGVTPRRWLLQANPSLATVITDAIGDGWVADLAQLEKLKPLADDRSFRAAVRKAKRDAKTRFIQWLGLPGIDPDSIFDTQIKRIHEYKRQLLNALHVVVLYHRLRENPRLDVPPRTFFFGGKVAPAYHSPSSSSSSSTISPERSTVIRSPATKVLFVPTTAFLSRNT